jgi:Cu/Ag efflux protein CusF
MNTLKLAAMFFGFALLSGSAVCGLAEEKLSEPALEKVSGAVDMTDGVIRKVDKANNRITIRHGEIKNLEMPAMTMVFEVRDPGLLDKVTAGDKVKFRAEKSGTAFIVTDIQPL